MKTHAPKLIALSAVLLSTSCALVELNRLDAAWPQQAGVLPVDGAGAPLRLTRDVYGVPHVRARSESDAWFGLGFAHGQDRLFQADLLRHVAGGRLSEWLGPDYVDMDAFIKGMALREKAEEEVLYLNKGTREMLEAYARGLNAGAASLGDLPIEYRLLGLDYEPWDAADCLATYFLQSWNLSTNARFELAAWGLRDRADAALLDTLFRLEEAIPPTDDYWEAIRGAETGGFTPEFEAFTAAMGGRPDSAQASNNWVLGGERTRSGLPIVANDPHLGQSVPSLWYVADVAGGDLHAAGVTLPGTPGVIIGHNESTAWGFTNAMADVVDFALLEREGERGYLLAGERLELEAVEVEIAVKDEAPQTRTLWRSAVGPLATAVDGSHVLAMRWAALEIDDHSPQVIRALNHARSAEEAAALSTWPTVSVLAAAIGDVGGGWGWQVFGAVPQRRAHTGRLPYPASDPAHGWDDYYRALPGERAPERGYAHTANASFERDRSWSGRGDPIDVSGISTAWAPPHRLGRIEELLDSAQGVSPVDVHEQQLDRLDVTARDTLPGLLAAPARGHARSGRVCYDLLADWDYQSDADSAAAAVWAQLQPVLLAEVLRDELGESGVAIYLEAASPGRSLFHGELGNLESVMENRPVQVARALDIACDQLTELLGKDPTAWQWGALHPLKLRHPFGGSRLLADWNMPEVPWSGSSTTVAASGYNWNRAEKKVGGMVSMRVVMPLSDLGSSTLTHPGGQSGHPGHPDYQSHFGAFVEDDRLPLVFDDADVVDRARETLELEPR